MRAKVVLLGAAGVGKTPIVRRYVLDAFRDDYTRTLGVILSKRQADVALGGRSARVTLVLWDTMGEPAFEETLREAYLRDARGVLLVCDASDPESVPPLRTWADTVRRAAPACVTSVLVNKWDLGEAPGTREAACRIGSDAAAPCYLTSAKTGENVDAAFADLAHRIAAGSLLEDAGPLDSASLGIVIEASVRPRSHAELARITGLGLPEVFALSERFVRRGLVRIVSRGIGPDGCPSPVLTATGMRFPS